MRIRRLLSVLAVLMLAITISLCFMACDNNSNNGAATNNGDGQSTDNNGKGTNSGEHTHSFSSWNITTNPSCTSQGMQIRTCNSCGFSEYVPIVALGHTEVIDSAVTATCVADGKTEGKHCSVCDEILISQVVTKATGHTDGEWIVDREATVKEDGSKHQICSICKETIQQEILPATDTVGLDFLLKNDGTYAVSVGNAKLLSEIVIPATYEGKPVTSIYDSAFKQCKELRSITLPDTITSIGDFAFKSCENLTSINLPDGLKSIGIYAFSQCFGLTSITIPDGVTEISRFAFNHCEGLTSITIPVSVKVIKEFAFSNCKLTTLTFKGTTDQWRSVLTERYWKYDSRITKVKCIDGDISWKLTNNNL